MPAIPAISYKAVLGAILFWICVIIFIPILFIGLIGLAVITVFIQLFQINKTTPGYNLKRAREISSKQIIDEFNSQNTNCQIQSKWVDIPGVGMSQNEIWPVHYLVVCNQIDNSKSSETIIGLSDKPYILLIHGVASSSFVWKNLFLELSLKYQVVVIDMPGFGHSPTPPSIRELIMESMESMESIQDIGLCKEVGDKITDIYINFLGKWLDTIELTKYKPCVIGHSFGGFLSGHLACKYPDKISKVVLISSAGILPILDDVGALWAIFFKISPILRLLRALGNLGTCIAYTWIDLIVGDCNTQTDNKTEKDNFGGENRKNKNPGFGKFTKLECYYWYQFLAEPSSIGDLIVGQNITVKWPLGEANWHSPILQELIELKVPVSLIYGEVDSIMPLHQGKTIASVIGEKIRCFVIPQAGHEITSVDSGILTRMIINALDTAQLPSPMVSRNEFPICNFLKFTSFLSRQDSQRIIDALYNWLLPPEH